MHRLGPSIELLHALLLIFLQLQPPKVLLLWFTYFKHNIAVLSIGPFRPRLLLLDCLLFQMLLHAIRHEDIDRLLNHLALVQLLFLLLLLLLLDLVVLGHCLNKPLVLLLAFSLTLPRWLFLPLIIELQLQVVSH